MSRLVGCRRCVCVGRLLLSVCLCVTVVGCCRCVSVGRLLSVCQCWSAVVVGVSVCPFKVILGHQSKAHIRLPIND